MCESSSLRRVCRVLGVSRGARSRDGWAHLTAIVDCRDRACVGYELSLRARANEAERALETACFARLGTLRPKRQKLVLRSDNGLVFPVVGFVLPAPITV